MKLLFRMAPLLGFVVLSLAAVLASDTLRKGEDASMTKLVDASVQGIRGELLSRLDTRIQPLRRMSRRWMHERPDQKEWEFEAGMIYADYVGFQTLQWVDPQGYVRWMAPRVNNEKAQDLHVPFEERRREALERSRLQNEVAFTRPIDLVVGGRGFLAFSPIGGAGDFQGFILGVFRADRLFDSILGEIPQSKFFAVTILHDAEVLYSRGVADPGEARTFERASPVRRHGVEWTLLLRPTAEFIAGRRTPMPTLTLILGLAMASLVGLTLFFALRAWEARQVLENRVQERTQEIRTLNAGLENRVAARTAELQAAVAELEAFGYTVSHDLRAPLRAISGFSVLLQTDCIDGIDGTGRDYLRRMELASQRMDAMIQDLLAYSRLSRASIRLVPLKLDELLREVLEPMAVELRERSAEVSVDGPLPSVLGDRVLLTAVLTNLLSNAVKFVSKDRNPRVRIRAEQREGRVRLWVEDNGIGIAAEHQERIFGVFERLHKQEEFPGTGIGLAIVRRSVSRLGGRLGVESAPRQGSRFWIELMPSS